MNSKIKQIIVYGALIGFISIAVSVIVYVFDLALASMWSGALIGIVSLVLNVALLVVFGRKIRGAFYDGFIKYGHALVNAFIMLAVMTVLGTVYNYSFYKWIDPGYQERAKIVTAERVEQSLYEKGLSDKEIEKITDRIYDQPIKSAEVTAGIGVLASFGFGLVFCLIAAAMIKKDKELFEGEEETILTEDTEA